MTDTFTLRLKGPIRSELREASREEKVPASEVVRAALREHLARRKFRKLRKIALPFAEAQGLLTDEDIFRALK